MTTEAMTQEDLIAFYTMVLKSVDFIPDENHLISYKIGSNLVPVQVSGKRLVLPVREVLQNPDWNETLAFHPLSEAIIRGESPVIRKLKIAMVSRLTSVVTCLVTELMGIAVDHDYHKKLSPTQNEFLSLIPSVEPKALDRLEKLMDVVSIDGDHRFMSMYLKRGGEYKGKKYQRVCITDFPLIAELKTDGTYAFGVNLTSLKVKRAILALFNYVLPEAEGENYSYGSNSMAAPNLHALLSSFNRVASKLNKITHLFRKHLDNPEDLQIELGFDKSLHDLAQFRDLIPSLSGNEGDVADGGGNQATMPAPNTNKFAQAVLDREAEAKPAAAAAPLTPESPSLPWNQPQGGFNTPAAPAPAPAPVATTGNGISWNSVVSKNPALQQQPLVGGFGQPQGFRQQGFSQQPQMFQAPQQVSRGGYVQQAPQGFGNQGFRAPGGFNQQPQGFGQQQAVMFPNGI